MTPADGASYCGYDANQPVNTIHWPHAARNGDPGQVSSPWGATGRRTTWCIINPSTKGTARPAIDCRRVCVAMRHRRPSAGHGNKLGRRERGGPSLSAHANSRLGPSNGWLNASSLGWPLPHVQTAWAHASEPTARAGGTLRRTDSRYQSTRAGVHASSDRPCTRSVCEFRCCRSCPRA